MNKKMNNYWVYKITSPSGKYYIGITTNIVKRFTTYSLGLCKNQIAILRAIKKYGWNNLKKEILFISLTWEEACNKEIELIRINKETKTSLNIANGGTNTINPLRKENSRCKPVFQFDLKGNFIKEWDSLEDIKETLNFNRGNIGKVCRKKTFFQHGFLWCFKKDHELGVIPIYINKIGKNSSREITKLNINKEIMNTYDSITEAIKNYDGKNSKKNIYNCLKTGNLDYKNNYYEYLNK